MNSMTLQPVDEQISIVQNLMRDYVQIGWSTFDKFIELWEKNDTIKIHSIDSFRSFIFGPLQTAYSTFIGFCNPNRTNVERKGGLFGLYVSYSTQFASDPAPILMSPKEFKWLKGIAAEFEDCKSMFSHLFRLNAFCFVPNDTAINTKYADCPPPVMVDEYVPFNDAFKRLAKEKFQKKKEIGNDEELEQEIKETKDQYDKLYQELTS